MKLKCPNCKSKNLVGLMGSVWVTLDEQGDFSGSFVDYESSTELTDERSCSACGYEWTLGSTVTRPPKKFTLGDLVRKTKGSEWDGRIVGTYSTTLTPDGYCVESSAHSGSVQIYPAEALEIVK